MDLQVIEVDRTNLDEFIPVCFLNPKNPGYQMKREWLLERFEEGLKVKLLIEKGNNKRHGYIEYTPGEYAWRAVSAQGYLFIHCIWIYPNDFKMQGYGSSLIQECISDAQGKYGVAAVSSDDSFMATRDIYLKNGFEVVEQSGKQQLVVKQFGEYPLPKVNDLKKSLDNYRGWHIVYSKQCPWVARFIHELDPAIVNDLDLTITELTTAEQAQNAPSLYSVFNLICDGKLLADHYISQTRFKNILKKHA